MADANAFYADKNVTQSYGVYSAATNEPHHGTDYAPPGTIVGTKIPAIVDGTVKAIGIDPGLGNFITITTGTTDVTYGHLQPGSTSLKVGDNVTRNQVIANVGLTGITTGPHVHISMLQNGALTDPQAIINALNTSLSGGFTGGTITGNSIPGSIVNAALSLLGAPEKAAKSVVDAPTKAVTDAVNTLEKALTPFGDVAKGVITLLNWLTKSQHWWELGFLFAGASMIFWGAGIYLFAADGETITKTGAKAAMAAGAAA